MANTYSQIYIQIVFAVEGRENLIDPSPTGLQTFFCLFYKYVGPNGPRTTRC